MVAIPTDPVARSNQIARQNEALREAVASVTRERDFLRNELGKVQCKLVELERDHNAA